RGAHAPREYPAPVYPGATALPAGGRDWWCVPAGRPPRRHKAWMSQPCCWYDVDVASTSYGLVRAVPEWLMSGSCIPRWRRKPQTDRKYGTDHSIVAYHQLCVHPTPPPATHY